MLNLKLFTTKDFQPSAPEYEVGYVIYTRSEQHLKNTRPTGIEPVSPLRGMLTILH